MCVLNTVPAPCALLLVQALHAPEVRTPDLVIKPATWAMRNPTPSKVEVRLRLPLPQGILPNPCLAPFPPCPHVFAVLVLAVQCCDTVACANLSLEQAAALRSHSLVPHHTSARAMSVFVC